eukprot:Gb_37707 [translate_table: standard]
MVCKVSGGNRARQRWSGRWWWFRVLRGIFDGGPMLGSGVGKGISGGLGDSVVNLDGGGFGERSGGGVGSSVGGGAGASFGGGTEVVWVEVPILAEMVVWVVYETPIASCTN